MTDVTRVLVTGSRDWDDAAQIGEDLAEMTYLYPLGITVVHGGCPTGADAQADFYATANGSNVEVHPADWERYGKRAGFIRNAEMVNLGAHVCYAYIKNGSKGATMTATLAEKAGIPVVYRIANDAGVVSGA